MEPDKDSGDLSLAEECGSDRKLSHVFGLKKKKEKESERYKKGEQSPRGPVVFSSWAQQLLQMPISWSVNSVLLQHITCCGRVYP